MPTPQHVLRNMRRTALRCAMAGLVAGSPLVAWSQTADAPFPARPVRFIVPAAAGGPSDVVARLAAQKLAEALGQPVIVDNQPGAGMVLGTTAVARAPADGYTLLFTTSTPIVMTPNTMKSLPYDVRRDFVPVAHLGSTPLVMYVNASLPATDVRSLGDAARARAGALAYGSYGVGSSAHLLGETLARQLSVSMVHVAYKGVAPQIQDLAGGQVSMAVADVGTPAPLMKAGRIRAIAVTGSKRAAALPDVPTFAEQGISGMEPFSPWWGVFAPARTPPAVVARLSTELVRIARSPEFVARLAELGADATGAPADQAAEMMRAELARWQKIVADLGDLKLE